ncbi:hypothetical protein DFH08DRAFT_962397 [Mycena albidolilacea]|uniref:Monopolin complex subunit Csm1/Pcs1 C-terminal domain-containing protein n=1 Tax=Mycena albidolilacea TaxID=1033008 RepID=A0AAD6ZYD7_9AGAR|nr:hypothetical protein DFH08DRAFT_962397 [Mycena albidolilacea]
MSATGSERAPRSRAGPSKPVAKSKRKPAKVVEEEEEEGESDDFTEAVREDAEDEVMEVDPPPTRRAASRPAAKSGAKGKGKAKADAAPTKKQPSRAEVEVDDDGDVGASAAARAINDATTNNGMAAPTRRVAGSTAATKQLESLRRQLETAQANIKALSSQLEESYRVRHTESEELQQSQMEKYEEIIRTKDLLIKQHQEMLSRKEPLSRDGKTSVLHMVTREDADAEKRSADEQVAYWKGQCDERGRLLEEKEREIAELKQIQSDLQYEIKTERENSQKAVRNPPSSALRGRGGGPNGVLGSDDPKHSELVRFYEDVTNLLVTDIKMQEPRYLDLDEWSFTCIYTYADKTGSETSRRSLGFLLRFTYDPFDASVAVESEEELDKAAQYTPLNLDKEPPPFIDALQFLNTGFTFPRKQLPLFYNSLVTNMKAACEPESDQSEAESDPEQENDSVQLVE